MPNIYLEALPQDIQSRLQEISENLHGDCSSAEIAGFAEDLEAFRGRFPDNAFLLNLYAGVCYFQKETRRADDLVRTCYSLQPEYLPAKLGYAHLLLEEGDLDKIPAVFNGKFVLSEVYPERKVFHITEVIKFSMFLAEFFFLRGEIQHAQVQLDFLKQIAPDFPGTKQIETLLHPPQGLLANIMRKIGLMG
ncbi:MAG: hypothetical protein ACD_28C00194G0001 [uncultured bacterium]|nr:MAG: hypothetical protein ACD_28C00194G0001 [uncultured bacterium]